MQYLWLFHVSNGCRNANNVTSHIYTLHIFCRQKTLNKTIIILHNTLPVPALLYGSENWTINRTDAGRITAAEMKYMRKTAGYTWTDYKSNTEITKELNITPVLDKIQEYRINWLQNITECPIIVYREY